MNKLFDAYERKDVTLLKEVGEYCIQDTVLLQELVYCGKVKAVESLVALANVVYCPLQYILERGQQVRVIAQLYTFSCKLGFLIPDSSSVDDQSVGNRDPLMLFDDQGYVINMTDDEKADLVQKSSKKQTVREPFILSQNMLILKKRLLRM